jgi:hypothetical protein
LGNLSYVWLHWPLIVVFMLLLYRRDRLRYFQLRNALMATALVGVVIFALLPEAPPRFLSGYTGTVDDAARRLYLGTPMSWNNQYASFVSFHVGWTLIACLAFAATFDRNMWKGLLLLPAALTGVAVITTGNHFVVDAIAGGLVAVTAYVAAGASTLHRGHRQRSLMNPMLEQQEVRMPVKCMVTVSLRTSDEQRLMTPL